MTLGISWVLGFSVLGFSVLGLSVLGFSVLGFIFGSIASIGLIDLSNTMFELRGTVLI